MDKNLKFDKNGGKLTKGVENTEGRGEKARYKQLLLFPCFFFSKDLNCRHVKTRACLGKGYRRALKNMKFTYLFLLPVVY